MKIIIILVMFMSSFMYGEEFRLVTLQYPPYQYIEDAQIKGVAYELVKEAFNRIGHSIKVDIYPWKRSLASVKKGDADGIFTIYKTEEREKYLDYSNEVLINQETAFFQKKDQKIEYSGNLEELKGKKISAVIGVSYGKKFDRAMREGDLEIVTTVDGERSIRQLELRGIELLVSNVFGAKYLIKKMGKDDEIEMVEPILEEIPSYIAFSKKLGFKKVRDEFDQALKDMKSDGTYDSIIKVFFSELEF